MNIYHDLYYTDHPIPELYLFMGEEKPVKKYFLWLELPAVKESRIRKEAHKRIEKILELRECKYKDTTFYTESLIRYNTIFLRIQLWGQFKRNYFFPDDNFMTVIGDSPLDEICCDIICALNNYNYSSDFFVDVPNWSDEEQKFLVDLYTIKDIYDFYLNRSPPPKIRFYLFRRIKILFLRIKRKFKIH